MLLLKHNNEARVIFHNCRGNLTYAQTSWRRSNNGTRVSVQMDGRCKRNHNHNPNGSARFVCNHNPSAELPICTFTEIRRKFIEG